MCGSSSQEKQIAGEESNLGSTLLQNYNQNYTAQNAALQQLTNTLTPIAQAGPDQTGFAAPELAAITTSANENIGNNYAANVAAQNNQIAGEGRGSADTGDTNFGGKNILKETLASQGANQLSQAANDITTANYAQGAKNWQNATAGLQALATEYNPNAVGGAAVGQLNQAFGSAQNNAQATAQEFGTIAGGVAALGSAGAKIATAGAGG